VEEWPQITMLIKKYISSQNRIVNVIELFDNLRREFPYIRSKYELVHIIRTDNEI